MKGQSSRVSVGILTRRPPDDPVRMFGPPTRFFEECCAAGEALGLQVLVFDAKDVCPETGTVSPAFFHENRWQACEPVRLPDVLYDRAAFFDPVYASPAHRIRLALIEAGIPFINPVDILRLASNKWDSYLRLAGYDLYLPETEPLVPGRIVQWLDRYEHIYLKPTEGSQGTGIIEVARSEAGRWQIQKGSERREVRVRAEVERAVIEWTGNRVFWDGVYLIQEGISPEPVQTRTLPRFDLRALMQKDEAGVWNLTGTVARVNRKDVPTSNLSTGAWSEETESTLDAFLGVCRRRAIMEDMEASSFAICRGLDRDVRPFGELGIDFIPDRENRLRVIEINAKPGRSGFKRLALSEEVSESVRKRFRQIREVSVKRPFLYARTLVKG